MYYIYIRVLAPLKHCFIETIIIIIDQNNNKQHTNNLNVGASSKSCYFVRSFQSTHTAHYIVIITSDSIVQTADRMIIIEVH